MEFALGKAVYECLFFKLVVPVAANAMSLDERSRHRESYSNLGLSLSASGPLRTPSTRQSHSPYHDNRGLPHRPNPTGRAHSGDTRRHSSHNEPPRRSSAELSGSNYNSPHLYDQDFETRPFDSRQVEPTSISSEDLAGLSKNVDLAGEAAAHLAQFNEVRNPIF